MIGPDRKIKFLFVTAILLMVGLHALLPHHHHYDSHYSNHYPLPVESKEDHNEPESPDYQCHAFNHLLDDGYQHKLIQLFKYQSLVAPPMNDNSPAIDINTGIKWEIPDHDLLAQGYDPFLSLRDPPAFS